MNERETAHRARAWRVHDLAKDFSLEDLWGFDLGGRAPSDIRDFLASFWTVLRASSEGRLARARVRIGAALGWDDHDLTLPIPGCAETSVSARLSSDDRARSLTPEDAPSPTEMPKVKTVYVFAEEALYELSNDTIHALLHVAIAGPNATLAVYVKHRGLMSRLYMAAIWPARHLLIYPAFTRSLETAWRSAA
jgi:hypothetical protein